MVSTKKIIAYHRLENLKNLCVKTVVPIVGIGTTSPAAKLDVSGSGNFTGVLSFPGGVGSFPGFHFNSVGTANSYGTNLGLGLDTDYNMLAQISDRSFRMMNNSGVAIWQADANGNTSQTGNAIINGNVGIGKAVPTAKLHVSGQIVSATYDNGAATAFDMNNGNVQYTSASCGAMTMSNLVDGASYTIVVQGATSGVCTFTAGGYTYRYSPANSASTASTHTVYSMQVVGTNVYVSWISGF